MRTKYVKRVIIQKLHNYQGDIPRYIIDNVIHEVATMHFGSIGENSMDIINRVVFGISNDELLEKINI